jgi:hypothetical protein
MGISQSAVETLLHRARRRFKELYLKQEGSADSSGDCATVTHILEHIGRRNLRQDQKRMLVNHLEACKDCRARFPARTSTASPSESTPTSTSASAAAGAAG